MGPNDTVWAGQEGEFTQGTSNTLVDSSSIGLVDASGIALADDGTTFTPIQLTTWSVNETA